MYYYHLYSYTTCVSKYILCQTTVLHIVTLCIGCRDYKLEKKYTHQKILVPKMLEEKQTQAVNNPNTTLVGHWKLLQDYANSTLDPRRDGCMVRLKWAKDQNSVAISFDTPKNIFPNNNEFMFLNVSSL